MLTRTQIQDIAGEVLKEHGLMLLRQLEIGGKKMEDCVYEAGNLVALMELFAERVAGEQDEATKIIDARMGAGWTRRLAESLVPPNS